MNWLTLITLACGPAGNPEMRNRPNCLQVYTECIEFVVAQPEMKAKNVTKDDAALWLETQPKIRKKLCR